MSGFSYQGGILHAESVALPEIAAAVGTPTYVYSAAVIEANYRAYADAFADQAMWVHFALKANANLAVIALLAQLGAGADIVSGGELKRALTAGMRSEHIVFSGVGKTRVELEEAVAAGIGQINVESEAEMEALDSVARAIGRRQRIALRINPDVDARTHEKISTGKRGDKFGIAYDSAPELYARARHMPGLDPAGIAVHIGSQLTELGPFREAYRKVADLVRSLRAAGATVETLDLGGGIGVSYKDEKPLPLDDYAAMVLDTVGNLGCRLAIEPGRSIVASAGVLLTRAVYRKPGGGNEVLVVDAGMNDLVRPSMYGSHHPIMPVREPADDAPLVPIDVVGPICESGDTFARGRPLPRMDSDDLIVFGMAGAYGSSMGSNYNARALAAEVMVSGAKFEIVRRRQSFEAMIADERIPDWSGIVKQRRLA